MCCKNTDFDSLDFLGVTKHVLPSSSGERSRRAVQSVMIMKNAGHDFEHGLLLDLGCGTANLTRYYVNLGIDAIGVDISSHLNELKRDFHTLELLRGNGLSLPFKDHVFHTIVLNDVLEHIDYAYADKVMHEIKRLLDDKGMLYMSVANRYLIMEPHKMIPFLTWFPKPTWNAVFIIASRLRHSDLSYYTECPYTKKELKALCERNGLSYNDYTWFYAYSKIHKLGSVIENPYINKLVSIFSHLGLTNILLVLAEKVSILVFVCKPKRRSGLITLNM